MKISLNNKVILAAVILSYCIVIVSCDQSVEADVSEFHSNNEFDQQFELVLSNMKEDPDWALEQCDKLIESAENINSSYYAGKAKWYKAFIYDDIQQDVSQAYFYYNESIKDLNDTDSSTVKMSVLTNLGLLYRFYGQYDAAINSYEEALALKKDLTPKQISDLYYNYGVSLKLKGDEDSFSKAEVMFTKSLEFAKKVNDHRNIASVNNQIGLMYKAIGDYDMARMAYENNIQLYGSDPVMSEYVGKAWHGLGVTYMDQKNYDKATSTFQKALKYKQNSGSVFITLYDLGNVYKLTGDSEKAIFTWKKALNEKHDLNDIEQLQIYVKLTNALSLRGDYEEALGYNQIFNQQTLSIVHEAATYKAKNNQVLFADVVKEYELFNHPQPQRFNIAMIAGIVSLLLVLYVVFLIYYKNRITRNVSERISQIQSEFHHLKID